MDVTKSYLAVFENVGGARGQHMVIDLTTVMANLLAGNTNARQRWEDSRTPSGHRLEMIIPKEAPGVDPVALWSR